MKEKRFNVGDRVTYKPLSQGKGIDGYFYGGDEQDGYVGTVKDYVEYISDQGCWKINVTCKDDSWGYTMLESEFKEYDEPVRSTIVSNPAIGDKVVRGRDWKWGDQDEGSVYGTVIKPGTDWCSVEWVNKHGVSLNIQSYRVGNGDKYDLYYYNAPTVSEKEPIDTKGFKVGDRVRYVGEKTARILGFSRNNNNCLIEFDPEYDIGHTGDDPRYWYDENGRTIPYVPGERRYYIGLSMITKIGEEPTMEQIQAEAKRRYPIGCRYIAAAGAGSEPLVLSDDEYTYRIVTDHYGKKIWAHSGGGCLYSDGKWATICHTSVGTGTSSITTTVGIINEMSSSMTQMEKAKLEWEQIYPKEQVSGKSLALKHPLKHQKPVLRRTKTKSTKLVIK